MYSNNNKTYNLLKSEHNKLPTKSGIYMFKDINHIVIYIGKAINIKHRVANYFNINSKVIFLSHIYSIDFIITHNNYDALVLEQNLIKKYSPKYNILFKDDKRYPYIAITKEKYPRIIYTRKINRKKHDVYFGPFPDGSYAKKIYELLSRTFMYRKCVSLPKKSCIYYDMKQCLAPCINNVDISIYEEYKKEIKLFFSSNNTKYINNLYDRMQKLSNKLKYEQAQKILSLINSIKEWNNSTISSIIKTQKSVDVLGYYVYDDYICITLLFYRLGKLINKTSKIYFLYDDIDDCVDKFLYENYMQNIEPNYLFYSKELNIKYFLKIHNIKKATFLPINIITIAERNSKEFLLLNYKKYTNALLNNEKAWNAFLNILKLKNINYMDIIDNSNINGVNFVSATQTYCQGVMLKSYTRKYNLPYQIKSDTEAIKYVISKKYIKNSDKLPDLFVVDGGINQVNAARDEFKKNKLDMKNILGIVKDDRHKTRNLYFNGKDIEIKNNRILYNFCSLIQENIHESAIHYFKKKYIQDIFSSSLQPIFGLGNKNIKKLLESFSSIDKIKQADLKKLNSIIKNKKISQAVYNYFRLNQKHTK